MSYIEYDSNNSGGSWWLTDDHWRALEAAGWKVEWAGLGKHYADNKTVIAADGMPELVERTDALFKARVGEDGHKRWLGALATKAFRTGLSLRDAASEWERVTGLDSTDAGCACCGQPHTFTEYDDAGEYVTSGPHAEYSASWRATRSPTQ